MFWNLPVCRDDREQQIPEWAMLMKPFSTVRKQGKVAEMTVKKCPYCSYEMEFPLREWIFKDLYLDSPLPEFRKYTRKMARCIVCPHCKKQSYFTSFYLWLFISLLVMSYPFFFLFFLRSYQRLADICYCVHLPRGQRYGLHQRSLIYTASDL